MTDAEKQHRTWMKSLKVGDLVCDCNYKHIKIIDIYEEYDTWLWLRRVIYSSIVPMKLGDILDELAIKIGFTSIVDKELVLEGGCHCSAMSCCDPVDHPTGVHPVK